MQITEEDVKPRFSETFKVSNFQDNLNEITCVDPFRWKTYRFQEIVILE